MDLRISHCLLSSSSSSFLSPTRRLLLPLVTPIPRRPPPPKKTLILAAGRSKKKPGGTSSGRIEGNAEIRRKAKIAARKRARRLAESLIYRRNNTPTDPFSEEELQMIGLGYDRMVRFMSGPDDPNLRHPHDWFKYGRYGPYSWRGIVVGPPVRGLFTDERVTLISEVRDHEEFERIERHEMSIDYGDKVKTFDPNVGIRHYWFFVRHPRWDRGNNKPWELWTLAAEVTLEAPRSERLDKWTLMGRLGNKARAAATKCAAWVRPDIIYVKRPVYQCRFEPQDSFFRLLGPLLDPRTEGEYLFELKDGDGKVVDVCTYFAGLCKIVKIGQKAFVDDVTRAYEKLGDEEKLMCLEFLLENHPMELLHPFTKEWKAKLEEMELGCDAPDESEDEGGDEEEVTDWVELEDRDVAGGGDEEDEQEDDCDDPLESKEYWEDQWNAALKDPDAMERMVTRKAEEAASENYRRQRSREMGEDASEDEMGMESPMDVEKGDGVGGKAAADGGEDWECVGYRPGPKRRVIKSKIPPELFLRAAVRPYTYRNLVKEIVLLRHAIIDGEVDAQG